MAKLECQFFPGTPAVWTCNECNTNFGERCVPMGHSRHWGKRAPACIRCHGSLRYLGSATGAKPFWQMLPHFFAYPLHPNSLLLIGLLTVSSLLFGASWFTLFLVLFVAAVVVKYSFAVIEQRGRGNKIPPQLGAVLTGDEHHLFLRQIAVYFLMGVAVAGAAFVHPLLSLAVGAFVTLAAPASTIMLAVEKSVRRAVDVFALSSLMLAIGWPYLLLWFCTQIIWAGPFYIFGWMSAVLPVSAVVPVLVCLLVYFTLVLHAMLGYVLYEYQSELGFESALDGDEEADAQDFEKARALGEATVLASDGKFDQARACLRRALDLVKDDLDLHLHYHKLLMAMDDDEALVNHGNYLIGLLKQQGVLSKAVPIVLDLQKRVPSFKLDDMDAAVEIARLLQMQGQQRAVVKLFHNLHKTHGKDPRLPEAYLMVANILFEFFGQDEKALAMTRFVLKQYPQCPQRIQFERLQAVLTQPRAV